jgi:NADH-quinone oxidoreductase subunit L
MYLAIVFIPLLNFLVAGFFGRFLGKKGVSFFSATLMVLTSLGSVISFYYVALKGHFYYVNLGT